MRPRSLAAVIALMVLSLSPLAAGRCAADPAVVVGQPSHPRNPDPWERANRASYALHNGLDKSFFRPAALFFEKLIPGPAGVAVHSFLTNLREPVVVLNDTLQLRLGRAGQASVRFIANTTIGLLGFIDVAARAGVPHHDNDFGITMGRYGVPAGPYVFVPLLGPSTVRDGVGRVVDLIVDPFNAIHYHAQLEFQFSRAVLGGLDLRARSEGQLQALLGDAADPYATLRSVYLQDRQGQINGGTPDELPPLDDPAAPAPSPAGASADPAGDAPAQTATASDSGIAQAAAAGAPPASAAEPEIVVTWGTSDDGPPAAPPPTAFAAR